MDRRKFLQHSSAGLAAMSLPGTSQLFAQNEKSMGVALVGLGSYSRRLAGQLPDSKHCHLAAGVTGSPEKIPEWMDKHSLPESAFYNYENFDSIADDDSIDIVYVVLPNSMHAEFSIRAAQAGKHVICEKPMANTVQECEDIMNACDKAGVKLQIGYRLMYEPNTKETYRRAHEEEFGAVNFIESSNAFYAGDNSPNWRFTSPTLSGGGPMMDMGVYSVHAIRQVMQEEPVAVTAQAFRSRPFMFKGMEETLLYQMHFPNGVIANCMTSYSSRISRMFVSGTEGFFGIEPAFGYGPLKTFTKEGDTTLPHTKHQAEQFDAFARNIMDKTEVIASGMQGLLDMKVVEAAYRAMRSGKKEMV